MAKRSFAVALATLVLGLAGAAESAVAADAPREPVRYHRALCERLESKVQHLRAAIGRLEAMQQKIERTIESGQLTQEQLERAKHALRQIEAAQAELKERLARLLELYGEKCDRS